MHLLNTRILRFGLAIDGWLSAAAAVLSLAMSSALAAALGLGPAFALGLGLFMLGYGLSMIWLARRRRVAAWALWIIVPGNALWVLASLLLAAGLVLDPTPKGQLILVTQALCVLGFVVVQSLGWREARQATAA